MSLQATHHFTRKAIELLQISPRVEKMLVNPYRIVKTAINIELDDGNIRTYMGYRVQHNNTLGPMKGGLRYHPTVDEADVESLASLMTWKTSLLRLPFGGAKGGIELDPSELSEAELERVNYILVTGEKEAEAKTVNVRTRDNEILGEKSLPEFVKQLRAEIESKQLPKEESKK